MSTVGEIAKWCGHCGKVWGRFLEKLKIEPPHDPAILLLLI